MVLLATSLRLGRVADQVAGGLAQVHVESRRPEGVVVIEHQPSGLLVGVVEGLAAVVGAEQSGTTCDGRRVAVSMSGTLPHARTLRLRTWFRRPG